MFIPNINLYLTTCLSMNFHDFSFLLPQLLLNPWRLPRRGAASGPQRHLVLHLHDLHDVDELHAELFGDLATTGLGTTAMAGPLGSRSERSERSRREANDSGW